MDALSEAMRAVRCALLANHEPESPASRLRSWLRVGSSVQPRLQARVRCATGAIPTGAEDPSTLRRSR
jgi:hypothetical protein